MSIWRGYYLSLLYRKMQATWSQKSLWAGEFKTAFGHRRGDQIYELSMKMNEADKLCDAIDMPGAISRQAPLLKAVQSLQLSRANLPKRGSKQGFRRREITNPLERLNKYCAENHSLDPQRNITGRGIKVHVSTLEKWWVGALARHTETHRCEPEHGVTLRGPLVHGTCTQGDTSSHIYPEGMVWKGHPYY